MAARQEEKGPSNKCSCVLRLSPSRELSSLPGVPKGHTESFKERVSVRVLSATSEKKPKLKTLTQEASWLPVQVIAPRTAKNSGSSHLLLIHPLCVRVSFIPWLAVLTATKRRTSPA